MRNVKHDLEPAINNLKNAAQTSGNPIMISRYLQFETTASAPSLKLP